MVRVIMRDGTEIKYEEASRIGIEGVFVVIVGFVRQGNDLERIAMAMIAMDSVLRAELLNESPEVMIPDDPSKQLPN